MSLESEARERPGLLVAEDLHNTVLGVCSDSFDALLGVVRDTILAKADGTEGDASLERELAQILQGIQGVHDTHIKRATASLGLFAEICQSIIFMPPLATTAPQLEDVALPDDVDNSDVVGAAESVEQVASKVAALRQELCEVDRRSSELSRQLELVDHQLASYDDTAGYSVLAATAAGNKQTLLALVEGAQKLRQYMEQANQLRLSLQLPGAPRGHTDVLNLDATTKGSIALALELFGCPPQSDDTDA